MASILVPRSRILSRQFLLMFSPAILILLRHRHRARQRRRTGDACPASCSTAAGIERLYVRVEEHDDFAGLWTPGPPTPAIGHFLLGALLVLVILLPVARPHRVGAVVAAVPASMLALLVLFDIVLSLRASYVPRRSGAPPGVFPVPVPGRFALFVGLDDMRHWSPARRGLLAVRLVALVAILANAVVLDSHVSVSVRLPAAGREGTVRAKRPRRTRFISISSI